MQSRNLTDRIVRIRLQDLNVPEMNDFTNGGNIVISFLITYYNQKDYVKNSIESFLNQVLSEEFEILICDDGSNDGTIDIIKKYVDLYPNKIRFFVMERDTEKKYHSVDRVSRARKELLKECKGQYFCFLDGDDYYVDYNFVADALNVFDKDDNKKISVVAFNHIIVDSDGNTILNRNKLKTGINSPDDYIRNSYVHSGACVFRKDYEHYIERINHCWQYDDNDIVLYGLKYGSMYYFDRGIYAYVQYPNSSYNKMNLLEKSLLNCLGFDVDVHLIPEYEKSLYIRYASSLITAYVYRKRLGTFLNKDRIAFYYEMAKRICPSFTLSIIEDDEAVARKYIWKVFQSSRITFLLKYIKVYLQVQVLKKK